MNPKLFGPGALLALALASIAAAPAEGADINPPLVVMVDKAECLPASPGLPVFTARDFVYDEHMIMVECVEGGPYYVSKRATAAEVLTLMLMQQYSGVSLDMQKVRAKCAKSHASRCIGIEFGFLNTNHLKREHR